ncbi:hypothetical protein niasHT_019812 [Heterodera trifolii]|uniref:Costars domain-containing protein n=1 Tax=Heterodera trifolii TaxID=157864 RepID=A0ABD2KV42_9BILA
MPVIKHDPELKSVDQTVAKFNTTAIQTVNNSKLEHGSRQFVGAPKFDKNAQDYGRPLVGTKSQARGVRGGEHVMREVMFLCEMIEQNGEGTPPDCYMKFGPLFYMYSRISETLVGMLIRARKYGLIDFEGEMLYQRQDDHKKIRLLMSSEEINQSIEYTGDPVNIIKFNDGKMVPPPAPRAQLMPNAPPPPVFSLTISKTKDKKLPEGKTDDKMQEQILPAAKMAASISKQATVPPAVPRKPMAPTEDKTAPKAMPKSETTPKEIPKSETTPKEIPKSETTPKEMNEAIKSKTNKSTSPGTKKGNKSVAPPVFCVSFVAK